MDISIIFKIAGIGILTAVLHSIFKTVWERGTGPFSNPGRGDHCPVHGDSIIIRVI